MIHQSACKQPSGMVLIILARVKSNCQPRYLLGTVDSDLSLIRLFAKLISLYPKFWTMEWRKTQPWLSQLPPL